MQTIIPLPKELKTPELVKIMQVLSPANSRLVGGCVRDLILGKISTDIDIATTATPEQATERLEKAGIKVIPTGIEHGTITAIYNHKHFEITTLRKDISTDGRRATVEFTDCFKIDASRRDFTFNALYLDLDGRVYDYFEGINDLEAGRVRFIGNARERIEEDSLRILRYFRFLSSINSTFVDMETLATISTAVDKLQGLSSERITAEISKLLLSSNPAPALILMEQSGVNKALGLNGADIAHLAKLIQMFGKKVSLQTRLCAMFGIEVLKLKKLTLSNYQKRDIKALEAAVATKHELLFQAQKMLVIHGVEATIGAYQLHASHPHCGDDKSKTLTNLSELVKGLHIPQFPISGAEILQLGIPQGPRLGQILADVKHWWLENNFPNEQKCLEYLHSLLDCGIDKNKLN